MKHPQEGVSAPVGGPLWTPAFRALSAFSVFALFVIFWRMMFGIGAVSALNDGYAWGAWKILNVVVFTALGSGGYAVALLVYVMNHGHYHPLVRQGILTSALGYSTAVFALGVDVGRPWNFWQLANVFQWNLHSVLLEVAVCVTLYLVLLWVEMSVPIFENWAARPHGRLKDFAIRVTPRIEAAFPFLIAGALLLPTMHQSSLGSLMLLAGPRLHELWQTPFLPLQFLLACWMLGYAAVVITTLISAVRWRRPMMLEMLARISRVMGGLIAAFLVLRIVDIAERGALGAVMSGDRFSMLFLMECAMLGAAAISLLLGGRMHSPVKLFRLATLVVMGGALYRLNATLIGFIPGQGWSYFPSILELVISLGFIAMAVTGYIFMVKRFPILQAAPQPATVSKD
jgi:Ni/Fe-hydrogenase subunit HybB-like protein